MSRFLSPLQVEQIASTDKDGEGLWRLLVPLSYESDLLGMTVTAAAGLVTDFASVPRIPVIFDMLGDRGDQAATIHDCLYQTKICTRKQADAVLREALMVEGVPKWMANLFFVGVRAGGGSHW